MCFWSGLYKCALTIKNTKNSRLYYLYWSGHRFIFNNFLLFEGRRGADGTPWGGGHEVKKVGEPLL